VDWDGSEDGGPPAQGEFWERIGPVRVESQIPKKFSHPYSRGLAPWVVSSVPLPPVLPIAGCRADWSLVGAMISPVPSIVPTTKPYNVRPSAIKARGSPVVIVLYRNWSTEIALPVSY
jgi:hypothetical protein